MLELEIVGAPPGAPTARETERLCAVALASAGVHDGHLAIAYVDEAAIAALNREHRGKDEPTDVLSFPLEDDVVGAGRWPDNGPNGPSGHREDGGEPPLLLGDVVICPNVAAKNAPTHAGTYDDEVALLVVHGILHVLGMDHADPEEEREMQAKERSLLERFHRSQ